MEFLARAALFIACLLSASAFAKDGMVDLYGRTSAPAPVASEVTSTEAAAIESCSVCLKAIIQMSDSNRIENQYRKIFEKIDEAGVAAEPSPVKESIVPAEDKNPAADSAIVFTAEKDMQKFMRMYNAKVLTRFARPGRIYEPDKGVAITSGILIYAVLVDSTGEKNSTWLHVSSLAGAAIMKQAFKNSFERRDYYGGPPSLRSDEDRKRSAGVSDATAAWALATLAAESNRGSNKSIPILAYTAAGAVALSSTKDSPQRAKDLALSLGVGHVATKAMFNRGSIHQNVSVYPTISKHNVGVRAYISPRMPYSPCAKNRRGMARVEACIQEATEM